MIYTESTCVSNSSRNGAHCTVGGCEAAGNVHELAVDGFAVENISPKVSLRASLLSTGEFLASLHSFAIASDLGFFQQRRLQLVASRFNMPTPS